MCVEHLQWQWAAIEHLFCGHTLRRTNRVHLWLCWDCWSQCNRDNRKVTKYISSNYFIDCLQTQLIIGKGRAIKMQIAPPWLPHCLLLVLQPAFFTFNISFNCRKRLCANYYNTITVNKGSKLNIRFHSDSAENGRGFEAHIFQGQRETIPDSSRIVNTWQSLQNLAAHWTTEAAHMYVFPLVLLESVGVMLDMNYWTMEFLVEVR